ncbi:hypothetical protein MJO28_004709 [Puccinia striiformis f. sp. tritici]|uniref:Prenyltransferase alpha-alpha toroid domain-containing protein n=3 Tax=Puccinia striiformis TaxID=27350 RepID=A0A0L0VMI3_9BASI|nr:hypothetical protein Pst134EA_008949 [Puccinia striiformis f. sp. tritici]KAI9609647.1 hypothetical protein H4Q26_007613 [Puccinia striiformis f. sp. tritici PST-130]KNF00478.1 hypothetical protein PSTG_06169 [Puccinia striiformis f. sp. tritici PST-78]POW03540.1 hypothetical protein PSTT_11043 [Puccinia striiformis]KAH9468409.1 hypothetical protein Pst134EA_008949 [Puccinia striiformis f. sp. tritici]KAI7954309.1 hypothetical protein MJO28_004709 [Puccinia striiformis f. sp. tritici]
MPQYPLLPTPFDNFKTPTSEKQLSTELEIIKFLEPFASSLTDSSKEIRSIDTAKLAREDHISYLYPKIFDVPSQWISLDASRSWIMYWVLGSLSMLDVKLKPDERDRAIQTILSFQHPQGGFSGSPGPGHLAHLAATYACICCLAILLEDAEPEIINHTWSQVDIKKLYSWMLSLKLEDGSLAVQHQGEVDVRGCFGALAVATMLNLLTPELVKDLPQYLVNCQTHEGGMAATSIANHTDKTQLGFSGNHTGAPIGEAHGGYTSCALASYFFLQGYPGLPNTRKFDFEACLRWAAQAQASPIEGGGFRGRTNKLVDGCYIWWCGGLFPLLEGMIMSDNSDDQKLPDLCDRQALQEYILLASQDQPPAKIEGGLRDKPGMAPDMYHTHYISAGLSVGQHKPTYSNKEIGNLIDNLKSPDFSTCILGSNETESQALERMKGVYSRTLGWKFNPDDKLVVGPPENEVGHVNPVLNVKHSAVKQIMDHFYQQHP